MASEHMTTHGGSIKPQGDFYELEGDRVRRYVWVSNLVKGMDVLDAGCGFGYGSDFLAAGGARKVVGIDTDPKAISYASREYSRSNLSFQVMDVTRVSFSPSLFDAVISFEVFEHLRYPKEFLAEISKVLKDSGTLVISTPNRMYTEQFYRKGKSMNPQHVREYYPSEMYDILGEHFSIRKMYFETWNRQAEEVKSTTLIVDHMSGCKVPSSLRSITPSALKRAWWKLHRVPIINQRGKWQDFEVTEVMSPANFSAMMPVQIYCCTKD